MPRDRESFQRGGENWECNTSAQVLLHRDSHIAKTHPQTQACTRNLTATLQKQWFPCVYYAFNGTVAYIHDHQHVHSWLTRLQKNEHNQIFETQVFIRYAIIIWLQCRIFKSEWMMGQPISFPVRSKICSLSMLSECKKVKPIHPCEKSTCW